MREKEKRRMRGWGNMGREEETENARDGEETEDPQESWIEKEKDGGVREGDEGRGNGPTEEEDEVGRGEGRRRRGMSLTRNRKWRAGGRVGGGERGTEGEERREGGVMRRRRGGRRGRMGRQGGGGRSGGRRSADEGWGAGGLSTWPQDDDRRAKGLGRY